MTDSGRSIVEVQDRTDTSPVILHVPHASRRVPEWAGLEIDKGDLVDELDHLTDAHTDLLARLAGGDDASLFVNGLSRLVVDPERFPDDREELREVGMGAVYTRGYAGRVLRHRVDERLLEDVYEPYANRFTALVERAVHVHGRAVIIDVHSYPRRPLPYELHADGPRPQICLGFDEHHTAAPLREAAHRAFAGFEVAVNTPFAGTYVPLRYLCSEPGVQSVMIEIRRDMYLDGTSPAELGVMRVANSLRALVRAAQSGRQRGCGRGSRSCAFEESGAAVTPHHLGDRRTPK